MSGTDIVIVLDQNLFDEAGYMRRYRSDVASDIGVVGCFDEAPDHPPVVTEAGAGHGEEAGKPGDQRPSQRLLGERPGSDGSGDVLNGDIGHHCLLSEKKGVYAPIC